MASSGCHTNTQETVKNTRKLTHFNQTPNIMLTKQESIPIDAAWSEPACTLTEVWATVAHMDHELTQILISAHLSCFWHSNFEDNMSTW